MGLFKKKKETDASEKEVIVTKRNLTGTLELIATIVCVVGAVFQLYNAGFGAMTELQLRAFHWAYIGFLGFLLYGVNPSRHTDKVPFYDIICAILMAGSCIYLFFNWDRIARNFGFIGAAWGSGFTLGPVIGGFVAEEFGDHPEIAVPRMRWALEQAEAA